MGIDQQSLYTQYYVPSDTENDVRISDNVNSGKAINDKLVQSKGW